MQKKPPNPVSGVGPGFWGRWRCWECGDVSEVWGGSPAVRGEKTPIDSL